MVQRLTEFPELLPGLLAVFGNGTGVAVEIQRGRLNRRMRAGPNEIDIVSRHGLRRLRAA